MIPQRRANNHRCYSARDAEWVTFITRLKETGMPLKSIRHYADLRAQGEETAQARMDLLLAHSGALQQQIAVLNDHFQHRTKDRLLPRFTGHGSNLSRVSPQH